MAQHCARKGRYYLRFDSPEDASARMFCGCQPRDVDDHVLPLRLFVLGLVQNINKAAASAALIFNGSLSSLHSVLWTDLVWSMSTTRRSERGNATPRHCDACEKTHSGKRNEYCPNATDCQILSFHRKLAEQERADNTPNPSPSKKGSPSKSKRGNSSSDGGAKSPEKDDARGVDGGDSAYPMPST